MFALPKTTHVFGLLCKNPNENESEFAIGGRAARMLLHALCVFLCTPLFDFKMRTLIVVPPLLGKNGKVKVY